MMRYALSIWDIVSAEMAWLEGWRGVARGGDECGLFFIK